MTMHTSRRKTAAAPEAAPEEPEVAEAHAEAWTPDADDFINLKGKLYLPARRRVQWMRGMPVPHPDWTIDTAVEEHAVGKFVRPGRVEGGYALVCAKVYDEYGRLIATGRKSEYSENFADYLEKAETGAIARALAVAGYGTESAIDFDEGIDKERIADAPVAAPAIKSSAVPGVGRGGKTASGSLIQVKRIAELSRSLALGPDGMAKVIEAVTGEPVEVDGLAPDDQSAVVKAALMGQSHEVLGKLIEHLETALASR